MDPAAGAFAYHERTKHHFHRYARSLGYLDWATQPDPFRTFDGAPRVELPLVADRVATHYRDLYSTGAVPPERLAVDSVAAFFELALGLTAWKELGESRWALRADPSSGNLHPTEGYAVLPEVTGLPAGVHHYVSRDHCLEHRCRLDPGAARALTEGLPPGGFLVGISSIHWREAWKYGERAFRYCQHDAGHVIGTVRYAAAALGWSARLLDGVGDARVGALLGLDREGDFAEVEPVEREHPDAVLLVAPEPFDGWDGIEEVARLLAEGSWSGTANALSSDHVDWGVIELVHGATLQPPSAPPPPVEHPDRPPLRSACETPAATIVRQRRSAVALDGVTSVSSETFYGMLDATLPRAGAAPWDVLPWPPRIHLGLFVHRVGGIAPGLYLFERTEDVRPRFEALLGAKPRWTRPPGCPDHLRLSCIDEVDCRRAAAAVSCHQDIAADGAFSLGMLAEFHDPIASGAFRYRQLFWEAGVLGQVLYLEAEAAGVRSTGIGCYFDDAAHEVFGLEGDAFQSMYHFTVGGPVDDPRLVTLPPYAHLGPRSLRAPHAGDGHEDHGEERQG